MNIQSTDLRHAVTGDPDFWAFLTGYVTPPEPRSAGTHSGDDNACTEPDLYALSPGSIFMS